MNVRLYVNGKKIKFFVNIGWYKGDEFNLLKIELFNLGYKTLYILVFSIAKFVFLIGCEWDN
jgi:hypothetical protein